MKSGSFMHKSMLFAATVCIAAAANTAAAVAAPALAPHRAVYDVRLTEASDRSGITSMNGRIVYEFRGSSCDGYTTNFRFVTQVGVQGEIRLTDQRTTTFEEADSSMFRFLTQTFVNERIDREISGVATQGDDGVTVELSEPDADSLVLPQAMFPTQHMLDLLTRAEAGENFYEQNVFDGSEDGDRTMTTTVIIGPEKTDDDDAALLGDLADDNFRNVSITYFDAETSDSGEALPEYAIGFKMYPNGVTRALTMDYGDFSLEGALANLELFEPVACN